MSVLEIYLWSSKDNKVSALCYRRLPQTEKQSESNIWEEETESWFLVKPQNRDGDRMRVRWKGKGRKNREQITWRRAVGSGSRMGTGAGIEEEEAAQGQAVKAGRRERRERGPRRISREHGGKAHHSPGATGSALGLLWGSCVLPAVY